MELLMKPYAPQMSWMIWGPLLPPPSDDDLRALCNRYAFINSHGHMNDIDNPTTGEQGLWAGPSCGRDAQGRTIGQRIKAINPDFILSNYRNASNVQQNCPHEAAEVESQFPLGIAVWKTPCTLMEPLTSDACVVRLRRHGVIPEGMPAIHPFKTSTTNTENSLTKEQYVAWLRIGEEIMRIVAATAKGDEITLTVVRGIWGTAAASHGQDEAVFQPCYTQDSIWAGRPDANAPQVGIRYPLQVNNPTFHQWLGDKCARIFDEDYDVAWLDISTSNWFAYCDAYGVLVSPWNYEAQGVYDRESFREHQQRKHDALMQRFPRGKFFINNVKWGSYFGEGHERLLLSGDERHRRVHGGSIENYAFTKAEEPWRKVVDCSIDFVRSDFWGIAWTKAGKMGLESIYDNRTKIYEQFAYGTFLMAFEPGCRFLFGRGGEGHSIYTPLDQVYYIDLGQPLERFARAEEAAVKEHPGLYRRRFAKGIVLVNPTQNEIGRVALDGRMFDADVNEEVQEVALPPYTAKVLVR